MHRRISRPRILLTAAALAASTLAVTAPAVAAPGTTAWQNGHFVVDTPNVVRRANIVLGRANTIPAQSMPLGNGTLGAAVWAANGFTAQLNRVDTFPDRKSPGQVIIPGLSRLTGASDFAGYLDPYDGTLHESGGGMTLTAYIRADTAQLVVNVTGADPNSTQTAQVKLWSGRSPSAQASGQVATLAETWRDDTATGASGQTFGTLAGVTAGARGVVASTPNSMTAQVSFQPNTDGSFRVIVASPTWTGGDAIATANSVINGDATKPAATIAASHLAWWHDFWGKAGLIKISSADGSGDYVENLRTLNLYYSAAQSRGTLPGSQAGVANLFTFSQDQQDWYPAGYWFWNLRMQVQANLTAGVLSLNDPIFRLYQNNVSNISTWTSAHMPGKQGLCVPETMRYNGNGYYAGGDAARNASCDSTIAPSYNSLTTTTGAEIGLWAWQHYQLTDDQAYLRASYPLMSGAARFLLSAGTAGSDGLLHTRSNAHETQWDVTDPTTDIVARQALFPIVVKTAQLLGVDADLVNQLNAAIPKIPAIPRTDLATKTKLLTPADDASGSTIFGFSTQPTATFHNSENLDLEAVWPYNLIGDNSPLTDLAKRTFSARRFVNGNDWSMDSLQAARLGLANDVKSTILAAIRSYQAYPSGLASFTGTQANQPYVEQSGVLAGAVSEAFAQDYDGTLRIAPAWPSDWTGEGTVALKHNSKLHLQVSNGSAGTVAIESGSNTPIVVRSPWPGQSVTVVDGVSGATVVAAQSNTTFTIPAQTGKSYLVQRTSAPTTGLPFASISGTPASAAKHLSNASIGLDRAGAAPGISLRSHANGNYVTAGSAPLIASATSIGAAEQFDQLDAGNGNIALRARVNGQIVCADNAGAAPLIANRAAIGPWETFTLVRNPDGSVSLRSLVNNNYVTAENGGAAALIANRAAIGPWEEFDLVTT
jgi:hypothetical protein